MDSFWIFRVCTSSCEPDVRKIPYAPTPRVARGSAPDMPPVGQPRERKERRRVRQAAWSNKTARGFGLGDIRTSAGQSRGVDGRKRRRQQRLRDLKRVLLGLHNPLGNVLRLAVAAVTRPVRPPRRPALLDDRRDDVVQLALPAPERAVRWQRRPHLGSQQRRAPRDCVAHLEEVLRRRRSTEREWLCEEL